MKFPRRNPTPFLMAGLISAASAVTFFISQRASVEEAVLAGALSGLGYLLGRAEQASVARAPKVRVVQGYQAAYWVHTARESHYYGMKRVKPLQLRRVGFHVIYLEGSISHRYLDTQWHILTRDEVTDLQDALLKRGAAQPRGANHRAGLELTERGREWFVVLAEEYLRVGPTPQEFSRHGEITKARILHRIHSPQQRSQPKTPPDIP